ncbi:RloB domain-containing protein [Curtobacterium sp. YC1]|uniref:RloB family protein n=1 Tax=Curtobacterium sp. YC1 TaxID=2795488 RepID=UPI0018E54F15|nr:RloB family protein [Curtobacterium sp. YC1]QQD77095.1 RloB domain-containing protein [Curtobacterium sp. YC1]
MLRVYSEGEATEIDYIDALRRLPEVSEAAAVEVVVEMVGASPLTLVEAAREAKRVASSEVDSYWCVFDVESPDSHPYLKEAAIMARDNGIRLAISNPCFEVWLILHLAAQNAYLTTDEAVHRRSELDGSSDKHVDADLYMPRRGDAVRRAQSLRKRHAGDGTQFPSDNPSTTFDGFLAGLPGAMK